MSLVALGWLFTAGVLAHNTEEAIYLPDWMARNYPRQAPARHAFRFGAIVLSLILIALAAAMSRAGAHGVAAYLFCGYVFAMVANVFAPHVFASLATRTYMPGTGTALLLNLPLGGLFLYRALTEDFIRPDTFIWVAPLTALVMLASIPILFAVGRKF